MMTTYLQPHHQWEYAKVEDKDVDELLQEVRSKVSDAVLIKHQWYIQPHWFKPDERIDFYTVYIDLGNGEAQIVNFPGTKSSINPHVSKETIMTYLIGLLAGFQMRFNQIKNQ